MILINRINLAVQEALATEASRYTMQAIRLNGNGTCATDGHIAAIVSLPTEHKPEQFPVIAGFDTTRNSGEQTLVSAENVKRLAKLIPRKTSIPVLKNAAVVIDSDGGAQFAVTDLDSHTVIQHKAETGNFPNVEQVLKLVDDEKKADSIVIGFDAKLLLKMCKMAIAATDGNRIAAVKLTVTGATQSMKFESKNEDSGQTLTGVIMPIRL